VGKLGNVLGKDYDMKIFLANSSKQAIGGGWSWIRSFRHGMGDCITSNYDEADTYLIPSPTMVQREEVQQAKRDGKKIVLRIDNAVRNSRNRNTGMSRMKDFYDWADVVVFQSQWSKDYLTPFLGGREGIHVVLNGVETSLFNDGARLDSGRNVYLYSRYNRDETKNFEMARYVYSQIHTDMGGDCELWIMGQFSPELVEGNFDFYNNERIKFWGVQDYQNLPSIYKSAGNLIYTYFNDACSNTLIEALCCGCHITDPYRMLTTGGAAEIIAAYHAYGPEYFSLERMCSEYREAINV
jgi:glycosyltransferase involved in cell wall biosynthesis